MFWKNYCVPYLRGRLNPRSEWGASLVEYALLVSLIAVVCVAAVSTLGKNVSKTFSGVGGSLNP